jgi:hypothetical protein
MNIHDSSPDSDGEIVGFMTYSLGNWRNTSWTEIISFFWWPRTITMGCSYTITFSSGHMFDHRGRTQKLWSRGVLPRRWRDGAGVVTRCRWLGRLQPYGDWYKSFCTDMASVSFKEGSEPHWWIVLFQTSANSPCCSVEQRAVLWKSGDLAEDKNWNQFFESNIYQQTELLPAPTLFCLSNPKKPRGDIMESGGK